MGVSVRAERAAFFDGAARAQRVDAPVFIYSEFYNLDDAVHLQRSLINEKKLMKKLKKKRKVLKRKKKEKERKRKKLIKGKKENGQQGGPLL